MPPRSAASEPDPIPGFRTGDALKLLQGLGAQAAGAARALAEELAAASGQAPEPLARVGAQLTQLSTMWAAPVQAMMKQQREFLDLMAAWANQQKEFAERLAKLAESNQRIADQISTVLGPLVDTAGAVNERATRARKPRT